MVHIGNDWDNILASEFDSDYYRQLRDFLVQEYRTQTIYPNMYDIFNAFKSVAYSDVKVVILGQDPYHGEGQAHGLCFSVKEGVKNPPSLQNIFKEYTSDLGYPMPSSGCLQKWANNGVLLLNTVLTVRAGQAFSHTKRGWETFTDNVIKKLNERQTPMVFLLWGGPARKKAQLITNPSHLILECAHPSPLSAYNGYFGCKHFTKANEFLRETNIGEIDWKLD